MQQQSPHTYRNDPDAYSASFANMQARETDPKSPPIDIPKTLTACSKRSNTHSGNSKNHCSLVLSTADTQFNRGRLYASPNSSKDSLFAQSSREVSPSTPTTFVFDAHPAEGLGGKYRMPTFKGRTGSGAFAVYDPKTGESNEEGVLARRSSVGGNGAAQYGQGNLEKRPGSSGVEKSNMNKPEQG